MSYEKQILIEQETKLDALQAQLDTYWPDYPPKSLVQEYFDKLFYVNELKKELDTSEAMKLTPFFVNLSGIYHK